MDRSLGKWKLPQPTDLKDEELVSRKLRYWRSE